MYRVFVPNHSQQRARCSAIGPYCWSGCFAVYLYLVHFWEPSESSRVLEMILRQGDFVLWTAMEYGNFACARMGWEDFYIGAKIA